MYAKGVPEAKELVDETLKKLNLPLQALFSTLGRTAARALETKIIASKMSGWYAELLENIKDGDLQTWNSERWEPSTWPDEAQGFGYMEAPRGALGHWIKIRDGKSLTIRLLCPLPGMLPQEMPLDKLVPMKPHFWEHLLPTRLNLWKSCAQSILLIRA